MRLTAAQTGYLFVGHFLLAMGINFLINGAIGWLSFRGVDPVPTWGVAASGGPDLIGTCFFLPAITCLIVTPIVRRQVRSGTVTSIPPEVRRPLWVRPFRSRLVPRALRMGLAGLVLFGGPLALVLSSFGPVAFGLTPFLWLKASFSAALAGVVQPVIAIVALTDPEAAD